MKDALLVETPAQRRRRWWSAAMWSAVVGLAALAVYWPALDGDYLWDDDSYVSANPLLTAPDGLLRIWTTTESPQYYPLVFTSFWVEARLWGFVPLFHHLVNLVLHVASALLLWRLMDRLSIPGGGLAALVFAVHPVHVESVAWISERKNVLSLFFYLCAFHSYLSFDRSGASRFRALSLTCFVAALLSKTVTCTLPAAIAIAIWYRHGRLYRRDWIRLAPMFAVGAAFGAVTVFLEQHRVGAVGARWEFSLLERCIIAGHAVWFYLAKLLWPATLIFSYPRWSIDAHNPLQYAAPAAVLLVTVGLFVARRRIGRGPIAAWLFYLITLGPALGFFNVYPFRFSFVADHFQYHASIGIIALLAGGFGLLRARSRPTPDGDAPVRAAGVPGGLPGKSSGGLTERSAGGLHTAVWVVLVAMTAALAIRASRHAQAFTNPEVLWQSVLAGNPASVLAHANLGVVYWEQGKSDQAEAEYRAALAIDPKHVPAHVNLAAIALARGDDASAMKHLDDALAVDPQDPTALFEKARLLVKIGRTDAAIDCYQRAVAADPSFAEAHNNLGQLLLNRGDTAGARRHFEAALLAKPGDAVALYNFGTLAELDGDPKAAREYYAGALLDDPAMYEAWFRLGVCAMQMARWSEAEVAMMEAARLAPDRSEPRAKLAAARYELGRLALAAADYEQALKIDPTDAGVRHNLAAIYAEMQQLADARRVLEDGVRIAPRHVGLAHDLAKLLLDDPDSTEAQRARALELAAFVDESLRRKSAKAAETLARALIANGRFHQARSVIERGTNLARAQDDEAAAARFSELRRSLDGRAPGS